LNEGQDGTMNQTKPIARPKAGAAKENAVVHDRRGRKTGVLRAGDAWVSTRGLTLKKVSKVSTNDRPGLIKSIRHGFSASAIAVLMDELKMSQRDIGDILMIAPATLTRRIKSGRLEADESDRVARIAILKERALELMNGDNDAALNWLRTSLPILGGESPLKHAQTEIGARDVEDLIGRLQHGVFS
jgi:putative toxin-antitoxin system antitoxin component (TIGR02293 family)